MASLRKTGRLRPPIDSGSARREHPLGRCIHELFEAQVERTPDAVALVFGEQRLTYRELNERANQVAHRLRRLGVTPDRLVGVCLERSPTLVAGLLGILKAGAAYVPLDPAYPEKRLDLMLADSRASTVLTEHGLVAQHGKPLCHEVYISGDWDALADESRDNPDARATSKDLAYIIYTSGSTGKPKGVAIEHRSVVALLSWARSVFTREELTGVLASTSICFDLSVFELFVPLVSGGTAVLVENALSLLDLPCSNQVALVNTVPSVMFELLKAGCIPESVRTVNLAGEPLSTELVERIYRETSVSKVYDLYGPTEDTTYSTFALRTPDGPATIGRPISNTRIYILDENMNPVPTGVPGEIYIGGEGLARGYLHRPELTAEKFVADPFSGQPGARLYRTGDLARYYPDGNIQFMGRLDDQVKIRGFRVELGEIESVLAGHPGVSQVVVAAREERQGRKRLVAYVVPDAGLAAPLEGMRQHLATRLPEHMVPSAFVMMDALPLMPNGKVDRRALPNVVQGRPELAAPFEPPRTPTEEALASIWTRVLGIEEVGAHDTFLELGGHSLAAVQVISRVREAFGVKLPISSILHNPSLASLSASIDLRMSDGASTKPSRVARARRDAWMPLSSAQERLWFLQECNPESPMYNVPFVVTLEGALNVEALRWAISEVFERQEALRTTVEVLDGRPGQAIASGVEFDLRVEDISHLREGERESEQQRLIDREALQPFDLRQCPLFRCLLIRRSASEHVLLLVIHHIAVDGWSVDVLHRELGTLYSAFRDGEASLLPEPQVQYADYAVWERERLRQGFLAQQLSYWRQKLGGELPVITLPTDHPAPRVRSCRGARESLALGVGLSTRLKALSCEEDATLFMVLLAGFEALLSRICRQEEMVLGTAVANRVRPEFEELVGCFVNTVVLRTDLSGDPSFVELLRRVRDVAVEAYANQELPFDELVMSLCPDRRREGMPLFQVMFLVQNAPSAQMQWPELHVSWAEADTGTAKLDLTLVIEDREGDLTAVMEYSTDLFERSTIRRMLRHLAVLLQGVATDPSLRISELPVLTEEDRLQLLLGWNDTRGDYPDSACIHTLLEQHAHLTPESPAVVLSGRAFSYGELNIRANQLAHHLRKRGISPDQPVAVCLGRSFEMVVAFLGILKAGGAYVPLEATLPQSRLSFILEDTKASVLVTEGRQIGRFAGYAGALVPLDDGWGGLAAESTKNPVCGTTPDNLAYVMYTSGSTGEPKGVEVTHRGVVRLAYGLDCVRMDAGQTFLQMAPISFDASTFELWGALLHGARCVLYPGTHPDLADLDHVLKRYEVSCLWLTASLFNLVVDEKPHALSTVSTVLTGGEALSVRHVQRALRALPDTKIINGYGPTESTTFACCYEIPRNGDVRMRSVPIGRPIGNTTVYILDGHMNPVPIGVPGELCIGGDGLARGYLNRPELTAEKFVPDPFCAEPGARLYRTGDLARYLPDGNIEFLGRTDDQVKIRGFRVEPGEVESTLSQLPSVRQSVVVARDDALCGKCLVAYVILEEDAEVKGERLRELLASRLPDYMVPTVVMQVPDLPLTPNGKVDRKALPDIARERSDGAESSIAPRDAIEQALAQMWQQLLGLERISVHDSFFELGGHSLLALRLSYQIEKHFGRSIPVVEIFRRPTVAELARMLQLGTSEAVGVVRIKPGGSGHPVFCLPGHTANASMFNGLAELVELDVPFYGLQLPGLDGTQEPPQRLEDIATRLLRDVEAMHPDASVCLAGYSLGGRIAYEMACQIHSRWGRSPLLVLFDAGAPGYPRVSSFIRRLPLHVMKLKGLPLRDKLSYVGSGSLRRLRDGKAAVMRRLCRRQQEHHPAEGVPAVPSTLSAVDEIILRAWRNYEPRPYPGRMVLFRAASTPDHLGTSYDDPFCGWGDFVQGGIQVHQVPCTHLGMFDEPHVRLIAERLTECLIDESGRVAQ